MKPVAPQSVNYFPANSSSSTSSLLASFRSSAIQQQADSKKVIYGKSEADATFATSRIIELIVCHLAAGLASNVTSQK